MTYSFSTLSRIGLTDIPLQGQKYTWSNMQNPPLLEKLDWVFTNSCWSLSYPETICRALIREISDHSPLIISISTNIPRAHIFRFENYWLLREGFQEILTENRRSSPFLNEKAKIIPNKFKNLRGALRSWSANLSNLKSSIANISLVLQLVEFLEEYRDLSLEEWNFRLILNEKLFSSRAAKNLLEAKRSNQVGYFGGCRH